VISIAKTCEEPKEASPCLSARRDRYDGSVLETLFLGNLLHGEDRNLLRPLDWGDVPSEDGATRCPFDARKSHPPSLFEEPRS